MPRNARTPATGATTPRALDAESAPRPASAGIDPRGPRFGAAITAVLVLVVVLLGLTGLSSAQLVAESDPPQYFWAVSSADLATRAVDPAFLLLAAISVLFAWGAFAGIRRHPYGLLFATVVRPRLAPPAELEDPTPPTFAQGVGFAITALGLVLHLVGVPFALPVAAGFAFVAAFLNAVFGYCLGCQIYLLLARAGILGRGRAVPSVTPAV